MWHWIAVAAGGAIGAMARYGVTLGANRWISDQFPWGTLIANALGCVLLGALAEWTMTSEALNPLQQKTLSVGFLGALTTYSTFAHETFRLFENGRMMAGWQNLGLNLAIGFAAVGLGIWLVRQFG